MVVIFRNGIAMLILFFLVFRFWWLIFGVILIALCVGAARGFAPFRPTRR